jgi:hypothetical protein
LQICLGSGGGCYALVAVVVAFLVGALVRCSEVLFPSGLLFDLVKFCTYIAVVIDDQRDFSKVSLLPLVAGKVPD